MEKQDINVVLLATILVVSNVIVEAEKAYFQLSEIPSGINCSDHIARISNAMSAIQCCIHCHSNGQCQGAVYDHVTMDCKEVHKTVFPDQPCAVVNGAVYYSKVSACDRYLVSGVHGVEDYQLSESSNWCQVNPSHSNCQNPEARVMSAKYGRLNCTGLITGGWVAAYKNPYQYIQVDFEKATTVTQVVMQARHPAWSPYEGRPIRQYVTHFKFLYSQDCSTFQELGDDNGNILTLEGNNGPDQTVIRDLPRKVTARCFRINPVQWFYSVAMRFDLIGCL